MIHPQGADGGKKERSENCSRIDGTAQQIHSSHVARAEGDKMEAE